MSNLSTEAAQIKTQAQAQQEAMLEQRELQIRIASISAASQIFGHSSADVGRVTKAAQEIALYINTGKVS